MSMELIDLTSGQGDSDDSLEYKINSIANQISSDTTINSRKAAMLQKTIENFSKEVSSILDLDIDLNEYMHETKQGNDVYHANTFQKELNNIADDSLIIYIKKAQLYKVYNSNGIGDFEMDESIHYRNSRHGAAYEVVRDTHPQKLMIVIQDNIRDRRLLEIKKNIVEYIKKSGLSTNVNDLKVYSSNNNTEFVISSIQLKNLNAKECFIEDFIMYMQQNGETELATKIQVRPPPCELKGARFYNLPSIKTLIDGTPSLNSLDQLISTTHTSGGPVVIQNNTIIINNNNTITSNSNNNITINKSKQTTKKTIKSFIKYLYDTKPAWYLEDQFVDMDVIEEQYKAYFNDNTTTKNMVSRLLKDKIFSKSSRTNGITKKKLFSYTILKTLF